MPAVQELSRAQLEESLDQAIARQTPATLTGHIGANWINLHAQLIRRGAGALWLTEAMYDDGQAAVIPPGTPLGVSFKLRHYKHVFTTTLEAACTVQIGGQEVRTLRLAAPARMQRIQRRAFLRADVPRSRSVLATFWEGGLNAQAANGVAWEGWVSNISAGGFQVRLPTHTVPPLEAGDIVGVQLNLGQEYPNLRADTQFRHQLNDERGVTLLSFQFVGLSDTAAGQEVLRTLARVVRDFLHLQERKDQVA
jgi:c-di-GMP-binding flagellar brake protein YcgR